MMLAGIPIRDEAVLELARLVDEPDLAAKLENAYSRDTKFLALAILEREAIIAALADSSLRITYARGEERPRQTTGVALGGPSDT